MNTKRFVTKILTRLILFAALMIVVMAIVESPILTNEVALGQMGNSSEAFMLMGMFFSFRNLAKAIIGLVALLFGATIICDIYKFIKSIYKEKN